MSADVLLRDEDGRLLLVKPALKAFWDLPGGVVGPAESPRSAARRRLSDKLGLAVTPGRLLVLEWVGPHESWAGQLMFVFDAGSLEAGRADTVRPVSEGIEDLAFVTLDEARNLLRSDVMSLLEKSLIALLTGGCDYFELA
ncbi:NUDIX domain-containing protein [Amycolatopsis sp. NPDC059021]|uniref:NUDIX domain-containing protein n=1 Tax=Amycolatopsis sp. NPDC059021 TaxID=3346704 RepID=UPI00366B2BE4